MTVQIQKKRSRGLTIILVVFTSIYILGVFYSLLSFLNVQSYDSDIWQRNSLPFYFLVFLMAAIGIFGIWEWKKWGVYCLAGAWVLTGVLDLVFVPPTPIPYIYSFLAILLVIAFFLLLLPAWQNME
jgi:hypothetical protein